MSLDDWVDPVPEPDPTERQAWQPDPYLWQNDPYRPPVSWAEIEPFLGPLFDLFKQYNKDDKGEGKE